MQMPEPFSNTFYKLRLLRPRDTEMLVRCGIQLQVSCGRQMLPEKANDNTRNPSAENVHRFARSVRRKTNSVTMFQRMTVVENSATPVTLIDATRLQTTTFNKLSQRSAHEPSLLMTSRAAASKPRKQRAAQLPADGLCAAAALHATSTVADTGRGITPGGIRLIFTARCYASAVLAMGLCLSVCLSVTSRSSTKTDKRRIIQITPHDSPGTLVFWCQRSPRNSTGVTPYEGAECRWGGSQSATFD